VQQIVIAGRQLNKLQAQIVELFLFGGDGFIEVGVDLTFRLRAAVLPQFIDLPLLAFDRVDHLPQSLLRVGLQFDDGFRRGRGVGFGFGLRMCR